MEQSINAESKSIYVGDAEYLVIDEVKTEPLDDDCPSDVVKINHRTIHACGKFKKNSLFSSIALSSPKSLCCEF